MSPPGEGQGRAECGQPHAGCGAQQVGRKIPRVSRMGGCDHIYCPPLLSLRVFLVCLTASARRNLDPGIECCIYSATGNRMKARFNPFPSQVQPPGKAGGKPSPFPCLKKPLCSKDTKEQLQTHKAKLLGS